MTNFERTKNGLFRLKYIRYELWMKCYLSQRLHSIAAASKKEKKRLEK